FDEEEEVVVVEKDKMIFQLPKFLSFTQLSAYRTCPLQYKFAHLLRIPVFGKHQMSFGKTMHAVLQDFFEEWLSKGSLPEESRIQELYTERWDDEWYPDDASREEYRNRGAVSLVKLFHQLKKDPPKPFAVEQAFTLKIKDVVIKGQIDRIDEVDGGLHIIDYKTGKPKTLDKIRSDQKDQLYIYQMAVEEIWEKPVKKLSYYYLEDNSQVDFLGVEKDLDKIRDTIIRTTERMKEGSFVPTPGMHCSFCDFADICEFRQS
ncbi:MAG: PD-(D/E)XK nuclease family protein, partial [bacterium]|nr:PD-(D/E)XK nuclease family protein [bacterium]